LALWALGGQSDLADRVGLNSSTIKFWLHRWISVLLDTYHGTGMITVVDVLPCTGSQASMLSQQQGSQMSQQVTAEEEGEAA